MKVLTIVFALVLVLGMMGSGEAICPTACTQQYDPICAQNDAGEKRLYRNPCLMALENCPMPMDRKFIPFKKGRC